MLGHGGSSAGSYLADPTSPSPRTVLSLSCFKVLQCTIVVTSTVRVKLAASPPRAHCEVMHMGAYGWVHWMADSIYKDLGFDSQRWSYFVVLNKLRTSAVSAYSALKST